MIRTSATRWVCLRIWQMKRLILLPCSSDEIQAHGNCSALFSWFWLPGPPAMFGTSDASFKGMPVGAIIGLPVITVTQRQAVVPLSVRCSMYIQEFKAGQAARSLPGAATRSTCYALMTGCAGMIPAHFAATPSSLMHVSSPIGLCGVCIHVRCVCSVWCRCRPSLWLLRACTMLGS
jgi:hypothetical protein